MIEEMGGDFLQWLRGFYFVAKTGSVTHAALEMRRNQPTVSHQIKCLENEFGVTLFNRASGKMELTPEGKVFLEKVISLFEIVKEMKNEIAGINLEHEGRIVVAATHAIIHFFLPRFIVDFRSTHPNVKFEIEGGGLEMILEKVESAEADFGIANLPKVPEALNYDDLFETRPKLIASKKSPFSPGKRLTLKQISKAPFLTFPHSSTLRPFIERRFKENDLTLNVVLALNNYNAVKKFVALGLGVSILDDYALTEEDKGKLDIFSLDRFFEKRVYGIITRKKKYLSPAAKAFIRSIKPDITFT
ncbi:MAG: LysR family transcriptional regulator [Desulfobacteraceae bacterium]|jgi:DNA-binding transcriptional LysR family regulator